MTDLRKAAKGKPCVICGQNDGTTVLHHIRTGHGGMGCKPPDHHGIAVCRSCHEYLHDGGISDHKTVLIAYLRQIDRWLADGVLQSIKPRGSHAA